VTESVVEIDRMPLTFLVAAAPGRAERVSRRVRDAVTGALPQALASACGRELDRDASYVFIDRLEVQCAVASHWADDAIAGLFAERLARALLLERDLGHALIFRDRPEFLSAFLAAAVDGGAFSRWWFAEFEGLAPLPLSACIRTVVIGEGPIAWQALARLAPETMGRVIAALGAADAERILEAVAAGPGGAAAPVTTIIDALEAAASMPRASLSHVLVAALVHVAARDSEAVSARTLSALRALAKIVEAARAGRLRGVSREATSATVLAWCDAAGLAPVERAALLDLDPAPLVAWIAALAPAGAAASTAPEGLSFDFTPFGGALVLCVVLVRAGWWAAWRDTLHAAGMGERAHPLAAWLALAVVARALHPDDPAAVERDPVLRRVFGVPESMGVSRGKRLVRLARARGRALLHETARRIPGCEGSSAEYVRAQCLSLPAAVRADGAEARLGRPPLDILLGFSGLKRASVTLPDGRALTLSEEMQP
jgi:hypothetical protein